MKPIFPIIDNSITNNNKAMKKTKKLKLNSKERLKTMNNISNFKTLKAEILNHFSKFNSPSVKSYKIIDFMLTIENFSQRIKEKPLKEYTKISDNLMERYTYYNPKAETEGGVSNYENEMSKTKADYFNKTKKDIQHYLSQSKKLMKTMRNFNPVIKFVSTEFKNPIDSLGLILKNKTIHDKVLNNYQNREMQTFGNNIRRINKIKDVLSLSKNVKVTTLIPAKYANLMKNDDTNENVVEKNNNNLKEENLKEQIKTGIQKESKHEHKAFLDTKYRQSIISSEIAQKGSIYLMPGFYQSSKTCPESREEFSLNHDPTSNTLFLFSGNSSYIDSPLLWKFNLINFTWEQIKTTSTVIEKRCGHTGVIYKSKLIIFGGRYLHNTALGDVDIYNIEQNYWEMNNYNTIIYLKLRRNHIACLVGQQMLVHGGIDEGGEYLDDTFLLSLGNTYKWSKGKFSNFNKRHRFPKLAYHSCCLVVPSELQKHPKFNIYKFPEIPIGSINSRIREKGIYVFGGKKSELKDLSNKMWVLKIGRKCLEWIELITKGKPPCPRYLFSMNFYEAGNFLIIHGGKTKTLKTEQILKDTFLFDLLRFEWIRVLHGCFDHIVKPRFSHAGVIHNKRLIIFGGVNEQGFSGSNFFLIKLITEKNQDVFFDEKKEQNKRSMLSMKTIREVKDDNKKDENEINEENKKEENNNKDKSLNKSKSKKKKTILDD